MVRLPPHFFHRLIPFQHITWVLKDSLVLTSCCRRIYFGFYAGSYQTQRPATLVPQQVMLLRCSVNAVKRLPFRCPLGIFLDFTAPIQTMPVRKSASETAATCLPSLHHSLTSPFGQRLRESMARFDSRVHHQAQRNVSPHPKC